MMGASMLIQVETVAGPDGSIVPHKFAFDGKQVEVAELLDQWHGHDHRYVKFRGNDGNLYILRRDDTGGTWELTMYETPRGHEILERAGFEVMPGRQPRGDGAATE
jgi:hypothetical protein